MYLTVEQSRVVQVTTRLDQARREVDGAEAQSRRLTAEAANLETALSRETEPDKRRQMELQYRFTKQELDGAGAQLLQIRNREGDLSQALQLEEGRWNDLISKLEQVIRK